MECGNSLPLSLAAERLLCAAQASWGTERSLVGMVFAAFALPSCKAAPRQT
jgi:hypothetical protein